MSKASIAIVILNWNGKKWLEKFLPHVIEHSPDCDVYVADNASDDDSVLFLKKNFPSVRIIFNKENYGFARGYNEALSTVKAEYYILLNSDIEVEKNWIQPVISLMETDREIAVCMPKIMDYNQRNQFEYAGACGGFIDKFGYPFCRGRLFNEMETDKGQYDQPSEIFWATGACFFIRSAVFHEMNGFDSDFFAHMEEIDLCWRIKNHGYKIYVAPTSRIYHVGGGTLQKTNPYKTYLNFRNSLITLTKNSFIGFTAGKIFIRLLLDGVAGIKFLSEGKINHCMAIIHAHWSYFFHLPQHLKKRKEQKKSVGFQPERRGILNKSIVLLHYVKGIKKFSELKW